MKIKNKLKLLIVVSLTLTSLTTPSAKAEIRSIKKANKCLSVSQMESLSEYKKDCDVCKLDLEDTQLKLESCFQRGAPVDAWWSKPQFVIGGFAVSFGLGALLALSLSK